MPALNFQPQFAPLIAERRKPHSIRAMRLRPILTDDPIYLYTGMRTKACRLIGTARCAGILKLEIDVDDRQIRVIGVDWGQQPYARAIPNPYPLGKLDRTQEANLIYDDGFDSADDFYAFFRRSPATKQGTFEGHLIIWGNTFAPPCQMYRIHFNGQVPIYPDGFAWLPGLQYAHVQAGGGWTKDDEFTTEAEFLQSVADEPVAEGWTRIVAIFDRAAA